MSEVTPTATPSPAAAPTPAPAAASSPAPSAAPAAAPSPAPSATPSVLTSTADDKPAAAPATWPDDWRTRLAKGDEKIAKRLERYTAPEAIADALIAAQNKLTSGELKTALPKDAKPEEVAAWRKENGIPEKPDDYAKALPGGLVIGDDDKAMIGDFFAAAHAKNLPPEGVGAMVDWYYKNQERLQQEQAVQDQEAVKAAQDALHAKYGNDYRLNITGLESLFGAQKDGSFKGSFYMPEPIAQALANSRMADGKPVLSDPSVIDWFIAQSRELYPDVFRTVAPGSGGAPGVGLDTRKLEIEKMMRENRREYDRNPKLAEEYMNITRALERHKSRAA